MKSVYNRKRARVLVVDLVRERAHEITWVVHRGEQLCFDEFPIGLFFLVKVRKLFVVIEFQTGCRVTDGKEIRSWAIKEARETLARYEHHNVVSAIETATHHNYTLEECQGFKLNSLIEKKKEEVNETI